MIYQADWLFPGDSPPIRDGWIRVEGDRITATGGGTGGTEGGAGLPAGVSPEGVRRLEGCALLPGLINAHCHLELTTLHDRLDRGKPFPVWVEQLRGHTAGLGDADYRHAARQGVRRLLAGGATTVVDVGNTGAALPVLAESPLRSFALVETLGIDPALAAPRFEAAATLVKKAAGIAATEGFRPARFQSGVAAHAAYSCSRDLLDTVRRHQAERGLPFTIHAAESREEAELFAASTGPLAEYCRRIHAGAPRHRGTTPVRWLEDEGLLPDGALIVHGNMLDDADMDILARRGATVVHCPSSHAFFGHPRFPFEKLQERGVPVCFGTDSLASGDSLSMLEQMRLLRREFPETSVEDTLRMASTAAARALGMGDRIGTLSAGYKADFVAVKGFPGDSAATRAEQDPDTVTLTVIDGIPLDPPNQDDAFRRHLP